MVFGIAPNQVKAEEKVQVSNDVIGKIEQDNSGIQADDEVQVEPTVLYELEAEREENVKHFLMSNHQVQAVMYSEPVHYQKDGEWKDIDNTLSLEEAQSSDDFNGYTNAQGDFSVKIAEDTAQDNLVKIEKDKYKLEFNLAEDKAQGTDPINESNQAQDADQTQKADQTQNEDQTQGVDKEQEIDQIQETVDIQDIDNIKQASIKEKEGSSKEDFPELSDVISDEALNIKTESDSVIYEGITDNNATDLEYQVMSSGLKENIVINSKQDNYIYRFYINTKNLKLKLQDNEINAYDPQTNKDIFHIPAPFMYDANQKMSMDVSYTLEETILGYQLAVEADKDWINGNDISFPVTIDPIITTKQADSTISSTFISSKMATTNFYDYAMLMTGVESSAYYNT